MGTQRFDLDLSPNNPNRAKILFITASRFENDWISSPHVHYFTEIFYIKNGNGQIEIENDLFSIRKNQLVIINPYTKHTEISNPQDPLEYYVLGVVGAKTEFGGSGEHSIIDCSLLKSPICQCFENILMEMQHKQKDYNTVCQDYLEILLLQLQRKEPLSYKTEESHKADVECHKIKEYLDCNYQDKISLETLSHVSNLSKYYISHKFTQIYGVSPIAYLNDVRVNVSKELLKTTNHSIEDIATMTGFSSRSYFSQAFKKSCQITAHQYRKIHRESAAHSRS